MALGGAAAFDGFEALVAELLRHLLEPLGQRRQRSDVGQVSFGERVAAHTDKERRRHLRLADDSAKYSEKRVVWTVADISTSRRWRCCESSRPAARGSVALVDDEVGDARKAARRGGRARLRRSTGRGTRRSSATRWVTREHVGVDRPVVALVDDEVGDAPGARRQARGIQSYSTTAASACRRRACRGPSAAPPGGRAPCPPRGCAARVPPGVAAATPSDAAAARRRPRSSQRRAASSARATTCAARLANDDAHAVRSHQPNDLRLVRIRRQRRRWRGGGTAALAASGGGATAALLPPPPFFRRRCRRPAPPHTRASSGGSTARRRPRRSNPSPPTRTRRSGRGPRGGRRRRDRRDPRNSAGRASLPPG